MQQSQPKNINISPIDAIEGSPQAVVNLTKDSHGKALYNQHLEERKQLQNEIDGESIDKLLDSKRGLLFQDGNLSKMQNSLEDNGNQSFTLAGGGSENGREAIEINLRANFV